MVIELNEVDCSIVRWSKDGKANWKSANIDDLIHAYEQKIGRWEEDGHYERCSECGEVVDELYNYCPNCGARMEGE